jgi:hypothetical protein
MIPTCAPSHHPAALATVETSITSSFSIAVTARPRSVDR